jgi:hypothetical protein
MNFNELLQNLPLLHSWDGGRTWNTGGFTEAHLGPLVDCLHANLPPGPSILETGAGCSTISFLFLEERITNQGQIPFSTGFLKFG